MHAFIGLWTVGTDYLTSRTLGFLSYRLANYADFIRNSYQILFVFLGLIFLSPYVSAFEMSIDGVLDEEEWSQAREWTKYYESMPFSLAEPKHFQKVLILEDEKGMYFGFINLQSKDLSLIHI